MKSRGFSPNAHYLKYVAKRYSWLALISFAVMGFHTVFDSVLACKPSVSHGLNQGRFTLVGTCTDAAKTIFYASAFVAIFFAFVLFSFLWKKKEAYSTLSLGVSLKNQFLIRYLFGGGLLLLIYIILFFASYAINITRLGSDDFGLATVYTFNYTLLFCAVALAVYTLAVLIAILTGRFMESAVSVITLLAAPYTIGIAIQHILANFLLGASLAHNTGGTVTLSEWSKEFFLSATDYGIKLGAFVPFEDFFNVPALPVAMQDEEIMTLWYWDYVNGFREDIAFPFFGFLITVVIIAVLAFAAYLCFIRRCAEYSGKSAIYPAFYCTVSIIASLSVALPIFFLPLNRFVMLLLYCVAFAIVFFILTAFFNSSIKRTFCRYKTAIASVGALCLFALICNFGGLGYSYRVPELEEIDHVIMEYVGNPVIFRGTNMSYAATMNTSVSGGSKNDPLLNSAQSLNKLDWNPQMNSVPKLSEPEDIKKAIDIHKSVIAEGIKAIGDCKYDSSNPAATTYKADWHIIYVLKNGKTIERYYEYISFSSAKKIASIEESEAYREFYISQRVVQYEGQLLQGEFQMEGHFFEASDEFFSNIMVLGTLSVEEKYELLEALARDFADLSFEERYFSDDKVIGIIRYGHLIEENGVQMNTTQRRIPEDSGCNVWYVTEKYTRTLDFFERKGLMHTFEGSIDVNKVEIQEFNPYTLKKINPSGSGTLLLIQSYENTIHSIKYLPVTEVPESEWESYISRSRAIAGTTRGGILVRITYTSEKGVEKVIDRLIPNE